MTLIDVETLKQNLTLEKIEHDYSDEDLELLLNNLIAELRKPRISWKILVNQLFPVLVWLLHFYMNPFVSLNHFQTISSSW